MSAQEKNEITAAYPEAETFFREFVGAKELIQGIKRYCLWLQDGNLEDARRIPLIAERIDRVRTWRQNSDREGTVKLAETPHLFAEIRQPETNYWAFPTVSSERRKYIPINMLSADIVASNQIYIIPSSDAWVFGVLSSLMHMTWVRTVAGQLETRIRYSAAICYNTFPIPTLTEKQKETIQQHVFNVLDEREAHSEKTMAELYDPDKMSEGLREAHHNLDLAVERCYRSRPFTSDEERLEYLFKLYEAMIDGKNPQGELL